MEQGRDKWTDPRIDDLRDGVRDLAARMDAGFARSDERFDALQRTLMLIGGGIVAALIALIATILGVFLTTSL